MSKQEDNSVLVDERPDGVYVTASFVQTEPSRWRSTIEALHSLLAQLGYKRVGKQQDSDIGGVYDK